MNASDILECANLKDRAERLILANLLTDDGREDEANLLRDMSREVTLIDAKVRRLPTEKEINVFVDAYADCAVWTSTDENGDPLDREHSVDDIATEAMVDMREDCINFLTENLDIIGVDVERAGRDFWLTRNRHGAGFWDGWWGQDVSQRLTDAAHVYGESNLYVGDDGLIYC